MPSLFNAQDKRVIVRHRGPAGPGLPPGGTAGQIARKASNSNYDLEWVNPPDGIDAVESPNPAVVGNLPVYSDVSGKEIEDSGVALTDLATQNQLLSKQDKIAGKSLSTHDFTTVLKNKLEALLTGGYRGWYSSEVALTAAIPTGNAGDWALVADTGRANMWHWNPITVQWEVTDVPSTLTGLDIAELIYRDPLEWDVDENEVFTTEEKDKLAKAVTTDDLTGGGVVANRSAGVLSFFSLAGEAITISGTSDGTTNLVKVNATTTLDAVSSEFTAGGSTARLQYTGDTTLKFRVSATVTLKATSTTSDVVLALTKSGSLIQPSRIISKLTHNDLVAFQIESVVSMAKDEYIEVFVGNLTGAQNLSVHALQIVATRAGV
jgi:hypothetical protein